MSTEPTAGLRLRAALQSGYSFGDRGFAGTEELADADTGHFRQHAYLASLVTGIDLPFGLGASMVLPAGHIRTTSDTGDLSEGGLGDLEARVRQDVAALLDVRHPAVPRLALTVGTVAPTGTYVSRKALVESAGGLSQTLSLGRDAWWLLAEVELAGRLHERLGWFSGVFARTPATTASDGFDWASEVRASLGLTAMLWPERLSMALSAEQQWRGVSHEIDYFGERVEAINTGGRWLDLVPALRGQVSRALAVTLSARLPLWREVQGVQSVQSYALLLGVQGVLGLAPGDAPSADGKPVAPGARPEPEIARQLAAGRVTLVDYWASWCAPCVKLAVELENLQGTRPEVAVVRIDATDWSPEQLARFLPAIPGLPVVDVYGADGRLVARLSGSDAFTYAKHLPPSSGVMRSEGP